MASYEKKCPTDFLEKDLLTCNVCLADSEPDIIIQAEDKDEENFEISIEDDTSSENEIEIEGEFNNEDRLISRLYRDVVDDVMDCNYLREFAVDAAIYDMELEILQGHKRSFRRFLGIDFCNPKNCCGYLRRYAICHTGLAKKLVWNFFSSKEKSIRIAREEITNNTHLKVVSLGGGPGSDLVGFCSALQEIPNSIQQLDLIVVDINEGWRHFFPKILRKAKVKDYGSFSQCLGKKIITGFMQADLAKDEVFKDKTLSSVLGQADVLLMMKLTSFLCDEDTSNLLHNDLVIARSQKLHPFQTDRRQRYIYRTTADKGQKRRMDPGPPRQSVINSMKLDAKLIFIDHPYDEEFFLEAESLDIIYHDHLKYKLGFNPKRCLAPSIDRAYAHVAVLQKKFIQIQDSSDSEEG